MPILEAQVILPFFTNLPTDVIVNRFHFNAPGSDAETEATDIAVRLNSFYDTAYGSGAATRVNYIDWAQAYVKVFDLSEPTPRVPVIRALAFTAGTANSTIPTEVAVVASFHAAAESGVRFQRLYNRVYLGGLTPAWMEQSAADQFPRIAPGRVSLINTAMSDLLDANTLALEWVQVSRATGSPLAREIVGGWTDNSPDTQRRRSVLATSRSPWSA